jgi:hypothetical protein
VTTMHAPFTTEVQCKMASARADSSPLTLPDATRCSRCCSAYRAKDRLLKPTLAGAANPFDTACPRRLSAAGLRLPQTKLSRNSNQVARGRIPQFESHMPSHAVRSLGPRGNAAQGAAAATGQDAVAGLEWQPSMTGGLCKLLQECGKTFRERLFFCAAYSDWSPCPIASSHGHRTRVSSPPQAMCGGRRSRR